MQGIDPQALIVSGLREKLLKDMAGNAMTTTVVGAVMIGALMALAGALPAELQVVCRNVFPDVRRAQILSFLRQATFVTARSGQHVHMAHTVLGSYCLQRAHKSRCKICEHCLQAANIIDEPRLHEPSGDVRNVRTDI